MSDTITLLLCGDVMLGRGLDQILAHPGDPTLHESYFHDARGYVGLAERVSGVIPRPVEDTWPWGEALSEIQRSRPGILVFNLETSVTTSGDFAPGKPIHYRMSPDNLGCLAAAHPDVLAHVERNRQESRQVWNGVVRAGIDRGVFQAQLDPEIVVRAMFDGVLASFRWFPPLGRSTPRRISEQLSRLYVDGLR